MQPAHRHRLRHRRVVKHRSAELRACRRLRAWRHHGSAHRHVGHEYAVTCRCSDVCRQRRDSIPLERNLLFLCCYCLTFVGMRLLLVFFLMKCTREWDNRYIWDFKITITIRQTHDVETTFKALSSCYINLKLDACLMSNDLDQLIINPTKYDKNK